MFQSNVWPDMTAPDDSSVLIDLVLATQHQMVLRDEHRFLNERNV